MQNQLTNANIVTSIRYQWSCPFSNDLFVATDHVGVINLDFGGKLFTVSSGFVCKRDSKGFLMSMLSRVQLIFYN